MRYKYTIEPTEKEQFIVKLEAKSWFSSHVKYATARVSNEDELYFLFSNNHYPHRFSTYEKAAEGLKELLLRKETKRIDQVIKNLKDTHFKQVNSSSASILLSD